LAACIAYIVLLQRDAISMSVFDSVVRNHMPRTGNLASIHNLMASLAAMRATARTDVAAVLHRMAGTTPRRGIVIIISDLFDDEQKILDAIQHVRFVGHEVIVFHTLDPCEIEFPFQGMVEFEGLEIPAKLLTRPSEIRKSYRREVQAFLTRVKEICERNRAHYVLVNTSQPLHEMLSGYLAFRARTRTK
jgi:uncharacterized protein (DUF58 family)